LATEVAGSNIQGCQTTSLSFLQKIVDISDEIHYHLKMNYTRLMEKATIESFKSTFDRANVGCVITKGDRIISTGHNQIRKSRLKSNHFEGSLHAEMDAIMKLIKSGRIKELNGSTMFVSRSMKKGGTGLAMPCELCFPIIQAMKIKRIVFSTATGYSEIKV
jgi:deoxycytidylate deaminase